MDFRLVLSMWELGRLPCRLLSWLLSCRRAPLRRRVTRTRFGLLCGSVQRPLERAQPRVSPKSRQPEARYIAPLNRSGSQKVSATSTRWPCADQVRQSSNPHHIPNRTCVGKSWRSRRVLFLLNEAVLYAKVVFHIRAFPCLRGWWRVADAEEVGRYAWWG